MKKHILAILTILVLSFWTVKPIVANGYFPMHDDTQVARVIVMGKALLNGQFPVRWVSGLGYGFGYPLYNFYGPLPYYFGGTLYALGLDSVWATKTMMALGMILAGVAMYIRVQARFGRVSGILAGILYAFAPYHAVQLYVRGAVGELWAYAFLPLIFVRNNPWIAGGALAAVILSHTIMGYVTVTFYFTGLLLYTLFLLVRKRFHFSHFDFAQCRLLTSHFSLLLIGLGLSAFFWLPAIAEMRFTNVAGQVSATANFRDHFVCLPQLWNSLWGYGGSAPGCIDGMSFKIGKLHVILGFLGLALGFFRTRLFAIIGFGSFFMVLGISRGIWEILPGFAYVQYPWRLLTGMVLSVSVLGGSMLFWIRQKWLKRGSFVALVAVVIWLNAKLFVPQMMYRVPAGYFESNEELSWRVSRISDEYLPPSLVKPRTKESVVQTILASDVNRGLAVETEIDTETYAKLHVQAVQPMDVVLNRVYFSGWRYWVNGVGQVAQVENGLPRIRLPKDRSVVEMRFGNTPVRIIGNIITLGVFLWFLKIYGKQTIT